MYLTYLKHQFTTANRELGLEEKRKLLVHDRFSSFFLSSLDLSQLHISGIPIVIGLAQYFKLGWVALNNTNTKLN